MLNIMIQAIGLLLIVYSIFYYICLLGYYIIQFIFTRKCFFYWKQLIPFYLFIKNL